MSRPSHAFSMHDRVQPRPVNFSTQTCVVKYEACHRPGRAGGDGPNHRVENVMETRISEIADGIYRLSTFVPDIAPPAGFTFNQFLILADEPLLFHTGHRRTFSQVRD